MHSYGRQVDSVHMMSMAEILEAAERGSDITPDSIHACHEYVAQKGGLHSRYPLPRPFCI